MHGIHSLAKHHPYLLQGVLNFFMEQGKVALVVSEDPTTQAWFETLLTQQIQAQLDCEIIRLLASPDEDTLATFNAMLSKISVQQATQNSGQEQANYLLWVSENDHFTPERFQQLKNIILQLSGLQLKLLVSVTSDRWNDRLFDIAGRKIAYWFIPSVETVSSATSKSLPPVDSLVAESVNQSADAEGLRPANPREPTRPSGRKINLGLYALALLVLIGVAALWIEDLTSSALPPKTDTSALLPLPAQMVAAPELEANRSDKPSSEASAPTKTSLVIEPRSQATPTTAQSGIGVSANVMKPETSSLVIKTPAAMPSAAPAMAPVQKPETAPQVTAAINTLADCPNGDNTEALPTAKPRSFIKDTNYIFIKSKLNRKICLAPAGGPYRLLNLQANQGNTAYGNGPWRVYSPDLSQIEIYFQGARVLLSSNVKDRVAVIPR